MNANTNNVLVILATGKMGTGIIDAFQGTNKYKIYGTSRDANHPALISKGVIPVSFAYGDKLSIERALEISTPKLLVVITASQIAKTLEKEVVHGKIILDAAKAANVPHVILTSTELADDAPTQRTILAPTGADHLHAKKELEEYIKGLGLPCYSILRSASFFENFSDHSLQNPLFRGKQSIHFISFYGSCYSNPHFDNNILSKDVLAIYMKVGFK